MGENLNLRILFLSIFSANWEKAVIPFKLRMFYLFLKRTRGSIVWKTQAGVGGSNLKSQLAKTP